MRTTRAMLGAAVVSTALTVVAGAFTATASAATNAATDVTFEVTGLSGPLELSVPRSAEIDWTVGDHNAAGSIGLSSVRDRRSGANRSVTVSASISDVTNGTTTVPRAAVTYTADGTTMGLLGAGPQVLDATRVIAGVAAHSWPDVTFAWTPALRIALPDGVTLGNYRATLVHSAV